MESLTIEHIIPFVEAHRYFGYSLLFLAMVLEGEILLIIAGILAHLQAFDFLDVVWIALLGVVLGNILWYFLGIVLSKKTFMQPVLLRAQKAVAYFLPHFREKPFKSIFFSKFIYGANRATVLISGALKVSLPMFLKAEFIASVVWVLLYASLGYFLGYAAVWVTHKAGYFALLILGFVVGFFVLRKLSFILYERYIRKHTQEENHSA